MLFKDKQIAINYIRQAWKFANVKLYIRRTYGGYIVEEQSSVKEIQHELFNNIQTKPLDINTNP